MEFQLFIEGVNVTDDVLNLEGVKLTVGLDNQSRTIQNSITNALTVKGEAFRMIDSLLFTDCESLDKTLQANLRVKMPVCGWVDIPLQVNSRGTQCCPGLCEAKISLTTINEETRCLNDWDTTLFYEQGFDQSQKHPRLPYCVQPPTWAFATMWLLRQIVALVIIPLLIAVNVLYNTVIALCKIVETIVDGLSGLFSSIFNGDDFEYGNTKISDVPLTVSCNQLLLNLHYSNDPINLTVTEAQGICDGTLDCFDTILPKMPTDSNTAQSRLRDFCNYLRARFEIEGVLDVGDNFCPDFNYISPYDILGFFDGFLGGCGKYTVTPLFREIFEYHAERCGMTFKSSFLTDSGSPNYNDSIQCLDNQSGIDCEFINEDVPESNWQDDNWPLMTLTELAEAYACARGAEFRIINNCVYIEEADFFERFEEVVSDIPTNIKNGYTSDICYQLIQEDLCGIDKIMYCKDEKDSQGDRMMPWYRYSVKYSDGSDAYKGECKKEIPFAPARFMCDQLSYVKDKFFDLDALIDYFRMGNLSLFGNQSKAVEGALILEQHVTSKCKIITYEDISDRCNPKVARKYIGSRDVTGFVPGGQKDFYAYNWPNYIDPEFTEQYPDCPELYTRQFYKRNPKAGFKFLMEANKAQLPLTCDLLNALLDKNIYKAIGTHKGIGRADKYTICFKDCIVEAPKLKIKC